MSPAYPAHPLDDDAPLRVTESWPLKRWAPIARDRIGEVGAVTRLQRSNARTFFAMTTVSVRRDGAWFDQFVNGDLWPERPTSPRPEGGRPFAHLTGATVVTALAVGPTRTTVAFLAGVATTAVTAVHVASAIDEHDPQVDERTGAFVALTVHPSPAAAFRLVAVDAHGGELDLIDYRKS